MMTTNEYIQILDYLDSMIITYKLENKTMWYTSKDDDNGRIVIFIQINNVNTIRIIIEYNENVKYIFRYNNCFYEFYNFDLLFKCLKKYVEECL